MLILLNFQKLVILPYLLNVLKLLDLLKLLTLLNLLNLLSFSICSMTTSLHDWTERGHNVTFATFPSESMCTPRLLPAFYLFLWRACPNTRSYLKCSTNPGGRVVWLQCEQFMPGTWNLSINNPLCQNLQQHPVAKNVVKLSSSPIVDQKGRRGQGREQPGPLFIVKKENPIT